MHPGAAGGARHDNHKTNTLESILSNPDSVIHDSDQDESPASEGIGRDLSLPNSMSSIQSGASPGMVRPAPAPSSMSQDAVGSTGGTKRHVIDRPVPSEQKVGTFRSQAGTSRVVAWDKSASQSGNPWSSKAGFVDTVTGHHISRCQAIAEIDKTQKECGLKILSLVEENLTFAKGADSVTKMKLLEKIDMELDSSRKLLHQHSKGLLGSDLAELRVMKAEKKVLVDKLARTNRQNIKDLTALRCQFRHCDDDCKQILDHVVEGIYEECKPVLALGREQQLCALAVVEEKLRAVLSRRGNDTGEAVQKREGSKIENQFLQERVAALEKQVEQLTEQHAMAQRTTAVLAAQREKLSAQLDEERGNSEKSDDNPSSSSSIISLNSPSGIKPVAPAGKPKSGQPKRVFEKTGASSGEQP